MRRGRGKGKKTTNAVAAAAEQPGSEGEEALLSSFGRKRGRPQKGFKEETDAANDNEVNEIKIDDQDSVKIEPDGDAQIGKKRKRQTQISENVDAGSFNQNGPVLKSTVDEISKVKPCISYISRRKSKPRRAAEAGVECK